MSSSLKKCALAAAYSAATGTDQAVSGHTVVKVLKETYPIGNKIVSCPACGSKNHKEAIVDMIPHLNDSPNKWTREKIADWVKGYEDAELAKSADGSVSDAEKVMKDAWDKIEAEKEKVVVKRK